MKKLREYDIVYTDTRYGHSIRTKARGWAADAYRQLGWEVVELRSQSAEPFLAQNIPKRLRDEIEKEIRQNYSGQRSIGSRPIDVLERNGVPHFLKYRRQGNDFEYAFVWARSGGIVFTEDQDSWFSEFRFLPLQIVSASDQNADRSGHPPSSIFGDDTDIISW